MSVFGHLDPHVIGTVVDHLQTGAKVLVVAVR